MDLGVVGDHCQSGRQHSAALITWKPTFFNFFWMKQLGMVLIRFGRVEGIAAELALDYHLLVPLTHVPIVLRFDGLFHCGGLHFFLFYLKLFFKDDQCFCNYIGELNNSSLDYIIWHDF